MMMVNHRFVEKNQTFPVDGFYVYSWKNPNSLHTHTRARTHETSTNSNSFIQSTLHTVYIKTRHHECCIIDIKLKICNGKGLVVCLHDQIQWFS